MELSHRSRKYCDVSLQWRHNERDGVSNHPNFDCLLNLFLRRRSKKTSKLRVTGLYEGNLPWPVDSPHKGPVTRKMSPFDDVIVCIGYDLPMGNKSRPTRQAAVQRKWHHYGWFYVHYRHSHANEFPEGDKGLGVAQKTTTGMFPLRKSLVKGEMSHTIKLNNSDNISFSAL